MPKSTRASDAPTAEWRIFEEQVILQFRSAGYQVTPKSELAGFEFDLLVVAPGPFGSSVRMAVECKYHQRKSVGNTEIHGFLTAFRALGPILNISLGLVITNTDYSRQAHEVTLQDQRLKLLRIQELEEYLLGLDSYLNNVRDSYASLKDARKYMTLSAQRLTPHGFVDASLPDISDYLERQLLSSEQYFAFVLGDFGSGKTTIAENIHSRISDQYKDRKTDRIPFIFYLKTLAQFETEAAFVSAQLQPHSSQLRYDSIQRFAKRRKLILILDGFDEVATHASESQRLGLFSRVLNLTQVSQHIVITSRPSYFGSVQEINELIDTLRQRDHSVAYQVRKLPRRAERQAASEFDRALDAIRRRYTGPEHRLFPEQATELFFVDPLSKDQVIDYFRLYKTEIYRKQRRSPEQVYEVLSSVYDLSDLMSRPLLLTMFREVLLQSNFKLRNIGKTIGAAEIYNRYINIHLDRDWQKGPQRQFLTRSERLEFARAAALTIFKNGGALEASYEAIAQIVATATNSVGKHYFRLRGRKFTPDNLPAVVNDVRVCAFLNITSLNQIQFSHKSFMEFFVADIITDELPGRKDVLLLDQPLSYEILYFVGSFCLLRSDYIIDVVFHISHANPSRTDNYKRNLQIVLIYSEATSNGRVFDGIVMDRLKIRRKEFYQCKFQHVSLERVDLLDSSFIGCEFDRFLLAGEIRRAKINAFAGELELEGVLSQSEFLGLGATESGGLRSRITFDGVAERVKFSDLLVEFNGQIEISQLSAFDCEIQVVSGSSVSLTRSDLHRCVIGDWSRAGTTRLDGGEVASNIFEQCEFRGIVLDAARLSELLRLQSVKACGGLILVDQARGALSQFSRQGRDGITKIHNWALVANCVLLDAKLEVQKLRAVIQFLEGEHGNKEIISALVGLFGE